MRFTEYGAFVDIGGLDGFSNFGDLRGKLKHPQEALKIGKKCMLNPFHEQ
jgi:4-hydroxy-3-methylbut-2-enyl diphosphate reductase